MLDVGSLEVEEGEEKQHHAWPPKHHPGDTNYTDGMEGGTITDRSEDDGSLGMEGKVLDEIAVIEVKVMEVKVIVLKWLKLWGLKCCWINNVDTFLVHFGFSIEIVVDRNLPNPSELKGRLYLYL